MFQIWKFEFRIPPNRKARNSSGRGPAPAERLPSLIKNNNFVWMRVYRKWYLNILINFNECMINDSANVLTPIVKLWKDYFWE